MRPFRDTKLYDLAAVAPLILWYGMGVKGLLPQITAEAGALWHGFAWDVAFKLAARGVSLAFLGLQILLFLIRRLPQARLAGVLPRLAALIGANLQLLFLALPLAAPSLAVSAVSTALVVTGTGGAIVSAAWLGRAFAVFPQSRSLVTSGPYRYVRHPLYLAEQIATLGAMLQFAMPWSVVIAAASLAAQFPRMHYEEKILGETYREYRAYVARTWRLIPGLY